MPLKVGTQQKPLYQPGQMWHGAFGAPFPFATGGGGVQPPTLPNAGYDGGRVQAPTLPNAGYGGGRVQAPTLPIAGIGGSFGDGVQQPAPSAPAGNTTYVGGGVPVPLRSNGAVANPYGQTLRFPEVQLPYERGRVDRSANWSTLAQPGGGAAMNRPAPFQDRGVWAQQNPFANLQSIMGDDEQSNQQLLQALMALLSQQQQG